MLRAAVLSLALAGGVFAAPAVAQDPTLADIRQELSVLFGELQRLKRELATTGRSGVFIGGDTLQRVDQIEAELQRLTSRTEELEYRIDRVVQDGTNRVGDLEFRLCELEPGCDIGDLGETPMIGGEVEFVGNPVISLTPEPEASSMAISEQADFDQAKGALDAGNYSGAAEMFQAFVAAYPGGPLSSEAHFLRGEALAGMGQTSAAARAYLTSFSGDPSGRRAPEALLRLGVSLAVLGQRSEACVTLLEVANRFPGSAQTGTALNERGRLGCS